MTVSHDSMANAIRALAMDAVEKAKSGHPGLPMGAADMATVLFTKVLKYDASAPHWADRDRFVLSAGHGSMLLYALLYLTGGQGMTIEQLENFRQLGSLTPGHPEYHHTVGVEMTTGPLGQGISSAVGMALAERMLNAEFGDIVDHHTYVLCSDGDLMEGVSQEAIAIAGHLKLNRMIVLYDDNGISIDGPTSVSDSVDQIKRFEACGWNASRIDGHDPAAILAAVEKAQGSDKPSLIACRTTIGFGAPTRAGTSKAHGEALGAGEIEGARRNLHWPYAPFEVPGDILETWRAAGVRGASARQQWEKRLAALDPAKRAEFERRLSGKLPAGFAAAVQAFKEKAAGETAPIATRKAGEAVLAALAPAVPELITGSADLTGSNNTKVAATPAIAPGNYAGRYVHWGIREHGMAAAINGMALHGGFIPSGATFLVFSDYCRPSLRLAALMGLRHIEVLTHDSIGLGEDGPTHQPVEHLAALRAIPNLNVFRPADLTETLECWQVALESAHTPSILALTRQNLRQVRTSVMQDNLCARGAYELSAADGHANGPAQVSIFASGSEVEIALDAQKLLADKGVAARVVSVPCMDIFLEQDEATRRRVIGDAPVKVAVEAAIRMGWDAIIGSDGAFVGMSTFGASGPYKKLYEHFGITPQAVAAAAMARHNG
ncbi:transketolase [Roseiarcaceae bacterium H3SJ34-1]|uniref:transketolase n=1 Tax=Terripilifer ovatus TaxID=3032367 RepID=UPI003AB95D84|nr:transketolase [Roseiarcaceae bacterium H3SJ34-1]